MSTTRYAVIGNPIAHSRSPQIHAEFAAQTHIALTYERLLCPLDSFKTQVQDFFANGGKGLNVTVPFKLQAYDLCDHLSPRAQAAGAVNTLWMQNQQLYGCNTDGVGLVADLMQNQINLDLANILLIGAGGAARGALSALLTLNCTHIKVVNRNGNKATELLNSLQSYGNTKIVRTAGELLQAGDSWDLIINATSSSLQDQAPALAPSAYHQTRYVYDMMYAATPTIFMQQAIQQGAQHALDGLGMLVGQAAESFAIWHGVKPNTQSVLLQLRQSL